MRTKNFTQIFAIALFLIAVVMNCYAADDTRHLIVMDLDGVETATFSIKNSEAPVLDAGKVNIKNTYNGKTYSYEMTSTLFGFDMRPEGSATSIEEIAAEKWSASYSSGVLKINNTDNAIVSIYSITGMTIGKYKSANEIPVFLQAGIYIVSNGKYSGKLAVSTYGTGGTGEITAQLQTKAYATNASSPITLRSGNSESDYWNIRDGDNIVPVDISKIKSFVFSPEARVSVKYNSGNSIEIMDYNGGTYDAEPAEATDDYWDLPLTFSIGGSALGTDWNLPPSMQQKVEFITVFSKTEIIQYDVSLDKETRYPRKNTLPGVLEKAGRVSFYSASEEGPALTYIYIDEWGDERVYFEDLYNKSSWITVPTRYYEFNNNTNLLNSQITVDHSDGSLVVTHPGNNGTVMKRFLKK